MSAEIASLERVRHAVETIRRQHGTPTAERVIAVIGGGSKKTVLAHMRALRERGPEDQGLPPAVIDLARGAIAEIYLAGGQAEAHRSRALVERLSTALAEQEAQIEELAEENARLGLAIPELTRQRDEAVVERKHIEERLTEALSANRELESQLAEERRKRSDGVDDAIARLESLMTRDRETGPAGKPRETIRLPGKSGDRSR